MRSCYGATVADAVAAAVSGAEGDMVSGQHKCHVVVRKGDVQIPRAGAHCEPFLDAGVAPAHPGLVRVGRPRVELE